MRNPFHFRDRNKPNVRPNYHAQSVFFSSESNFRTKEFGDNIDSSDSCESLFRPRLSSDPDKKSKTGLLLDAVLHSADSICEHNAACHSPCYCCGKESDLIRTKNCEKGESYCDKNWSDMKWHNTANACVKSRGESSCRMNGGKPSYDLSEDHNNQAICDKYTSLGKCDIGDSCPCLSCVYKKTQPSQRIQEENVKQTANSLQISVSKIPGTPVSPCSVEERLRKGMKDGTSLAIKCVTQEMQKDFLNGCNSRQDVPSASERARFRRSFDNAASMVFHTRTGLPLTSSPAPVRRGTSHFDFDSSLNSVSAIRR